MARKRVVHETSGGGGGFGILGVVIGALLVVGIIFVFAGNSNMLAGKGGGAANNGPSVTINTPSAPRMPAPTTGSGNVR